MGELNVTFSNLVSNCSVSRYFLHNLLFPNKGFFFPSIDQYISWLNQNWYLNSLHDAVRILTS